jgi:hypothetical protein
MATKVLVIPKRVPRGLGQHRQIQRYRGKQRPLERAALLLERYDDHKQGGCCEEDGDRDHARQQRKNATLATAGRKKNMPAIRDGDEMCGVAIILRVTVAGVDEEARNAR